MGKNVWIWEPMISADKLYERWTGIHGHEEELARLIDASGDPFRDDNVPIAYRVHKVLRAEGKGIVSYCEECIPEKGERYYSPYITNLQGDETYYDFRNVAFLMSQITEYEKNRPELFYQVIENPDEAWASTAPLHPGLQTISAYEAIRRLKITPIELVDILNGIEHCDENGYRIRLQRLITTKESSFREYGLNDPYFCEEDLANVKIYQCDFDKYCEQWEPQIYAGYDSEENNYDVREMNSELLRLKQENMEQKKKIVEQQKKINELEAQLDAPRGFSHEKRTDAANEARAKNKLAVWKDIFPRMVRVYARMEQGRTYIKKDVAELFQDEGVDVSISKAGKITDAGLDYFWKLFTNSGRPIADLSKCGSPDVNAATTTDPRST